MIVTRRKDEVGKEDDDEHIAPVVARSVEIPPFVSPDLFVVMPHVIGDVGEWNEIFARAPEGSVVVHAVKVTI